MAGGFGGAGGGPDMTQILQIARTLLTALDGGGGSASAGGGGAFGGGDVETNALSRMRRRRF